MSNTAARSARWLYAVPAVLLALFVGLAWWQIKGPASREVESAMIGKPLPAFALRAATPDRPGLSRGDLAAGKPKLLNIFASWCLPCAVEAPQLAALKAEGVEIDGIAIRDRPEDLNAFLARNGNPFTRIGADDVSAVQLALGSSGVPETFVIDGKGIIRYQHIGEIRADQLDLIRAKLRAAGQ